MSAGVADEELVDLARAGNEEAFDAIVHRYRAPLVSYCRRWLDAHRSEEVVQHTLMKAFLCVRTTTVRSCFGPGSTASPTTQL